MEIAPATSTTTIKVPSRRRRIVALVCGIISAGSASLFLLAVAFMIAQSVAGVYDGPLLGVAVLFFTFPPALICTIVAVVLVGFGRSRLAWISLSAFALPFIVAIGAMLWESAMKASR